MLKYVLMLPDIYIYISFGTTPVLDFQYKFWVGQEKVDHLGSDNKGPTNAVQQ